MERLRKENPPMSVPVEMYQVSGHGEVDLGKYLKDKQQDDAIIKLALEDDISDKLEQASEQELTSLIKLALSKKDFEVQKQAAYLIHKVPEQERALLKLLVAEKIKQGLSQDDPTVWRQVVEMLIYISEQEWVSLNLLVAEKIEQGLSQDDPTVWREVAEMIRYVSEQEEASLQVLVAEKIKQGLSQDDPTVWRQVVELISYVSEQEKALLQVLVAEKIKQGLSQGDPTVWSQVVEMIRYLPIQEWSSLELLVLEKITRGLSQNDPTVWKEVVAMIPWVPVQKRAPLIRQALSKKDLEVRRRAVEMIRTVSGWDAATLMRQAFDAGLGVEVVKPSLYKNSHLDKDQFKRKAFEKTGSETTLVGGALKDRLIIRHIRPRAFLAWQKIYENYQVWKDSGFDYVPIEPIQSYRLNGKGLVDVFSGVLDLNLKQWEDISGGIFMEELREQKEKIISILDRQDIQHGHLHDQNFALRFFRGKDGDLDVTEPPRLYAIDFDAAVSS